MRHVSGALLSLVILASCGEPIYENAGSKNSLREDRKACFFEINQSPAAVDFRKNPSKHPNYPILALEEINRCTEGKGWKEVRVNRGKDKDQEQEAVATVIQQPTVYLSIAKHTKSLTESMKERLVLPTEYIQ